MKVKINVNAQRYENYGFHEGREYWKPKGGTLFVIEDVDVDDVTYSWQEQIVAAIKEQLEANSNDLEKFEYIDHEVIFSEAKIAGVDFSDSLSKLMNL
jgi:hypothetical protein